MENKPRNTPQMLTESDYLQIEDRKYIQNPDNSQPLLTAVPDIESSNMEVESLPDGLYKLVLMKYRCPSVEDDDLEN